MQNNSFIRFLRSGIFQALLLYIVSFIILSTIIFSTDAFLGTDDYYHARIADQIIEQRQLRLDFPWLPRTILNNDDFTDHHLLFHLYIAPWVHSWGIEGAKYATVSIVAGIFVAVFILLRGIGVRFAVLWALALFGLSTPFMYRLLMIRTQGASLLMLIIGLHLLFQKRFRWLLPLAFGYAWLYNGFVLLLGFVLLYVVAEWVTNKRFAWRPIAYCAIGLLLGLSINPYFPRNFTFIVEHLSAKVDIESSVRVGNEWYAYQTSTLLNNSTGALIILVLGILAPYFKPNHRRDSAELTLLLVMILTLYMVFKSRRFIEYFPAFALLYGASNMGRGSWNIHQFIPNWLVERAFTFQQQKLSATIFVSVGLIFVLVGTGGYFGIKTIGDLIEDAQNARDVETYAGASEWLQTYSPEGALVFQTDWDDFTRLFYHNTHNVYLVGLDPTYLQRDDPPLWDQWVSLTQGEVIQPSEVIQTIFGADYVVSDRQHHAFEAQAEADPAMRLVYQDQYSLVWRILPTEVR